MINYTLFYDADKLISLEQRVENDATISQKCIIKNQTPNDKPGVLMQAAR